MVNQNKISYFVKWYNMELKLFKIVKWMITLWTANLTMKYSHCPKNIRWCVVSELLIGCYGIL